MHFVTGISAHSFWPNRPPQSPGSATAELGHSPPNDQPMEAADHKVPCDLAADAATPPNSPAAKVALPLPRAERDAPQASRKIRQPRPISPTLQQVSERLQAVLQANVERDGKRGSRRPPRPAAAGDPNLLPAATLAATCKAGAAPSATTLVPALPSHDHTPPFHPRYRSDPPELRSVFSSSSESADSPSPAQGNISLSPLAERAEGS